MERYLRREIPLEALDRWLSEHVQALASSARQTGLLMAATPLGFFRSADGGERWTQVSRGLGDLEARRVEFLPTDDNVLFATSLGGLFRSADQGRTWTRCGAGLPHADIMGLALHPDGRTIYASDFTWGGVFRSTDGGESWQRLTADGLISDRVWTLAVDPTAPERVLAASPIGGVHLLLPPPAAGAADGSSH